MKSYKLGTASISANSTPVVLNGDRVHRLDDILGPDSPPSLFALFQDWDLWRERLDKAPDSASGGLDLATLVHRSPIEEPRKIICIGINYRDHIAEMKLEKLPTFPYAFLRPATCLAGHREEIVLPEMSKMVDWEAELGVVMGRRFRGGDGREAMSAIAGYTIVNDISARDWIADRPPIVGIDWVMQKGWDQFQPTGPWITPAQFVPDPGALAIELMVNGVTKQKSNTSQLLFGVEEIVRHLGKIMTLEPGDIIATGTPSGVGFGRKPPEFLKAGDDVEVVVEHLGALRNTFV